MGKVRVYVSALEEHCAWLHTLAPIEIQWEGEAWPTILHAVAASKLFGRPYTETIREAPTIVAARARVVHLVQRYPHLMLPATVRRYRLQEICMSWYAAYLLRIHTKAAE